MKRIFFRTFVISALLIFSFNSCSDLKDLKNIEIPETVSVQSKGAVYEFPLGNGAVFLKDKFNAQTLRENFAKNYNEGEEDATEKSEIKAYDFNPTFNPGNPKASENDVQQYLIKYSIQDIPISITDEDTDMDSLDTKAEFYIPNLSAAVKDNFKFGGDRDVSFSVSTGVSGEISSLPSSYIPVVDYAITEPDFSSIELYSGEFDIQIGLPKDENGAVATVPDGFRIFASVVLFDKKTGVKLAETAKEYIEDGNKTLTLSFASETPFSKNLVLNLNGTITRGDGLTPVTGPVLYYPVSMETRSMELKSISGLDMTTEKLGDIDSDGSPNSDGDVEDGKTPAGTIKISNTFNFGGMNDSLVNATIEEGFLNFFSYYPQGWQGIYCETNFDKIEGSLTVSKSDIKDVEEFRLTNPKLYAKLKKENSMFNKVIDLHGKDISAGDITLEGTAAFELKKASLVLKKDDPATVDIDEAEEKITLNVHAEVEKMQSIEIKLDNLMDFSTENGGEMIDTGFNFNSLLSESLNDAGGLIENIEFTGVKGYLFAVQPALSDLENDSIRLSVKVDALYGPDKENLTRYSLLDGTEEIKLVSEVTDFDYLADNATFTIKKDVFAEKEDGTKNYSIKIDDDKICGLINAKPDNLMIDYSLQTDNLPSTITLSGTQLQKLLDSRESSSIQIFMVIQLPFEFRLNSEKDFRLDSGDGEIKIMPNQTPGTINIYDVFAVAGQSFDEDLFKRSSADDKAKWQDYLDIIGSIEISYFATNTFGIELSANLIADGADGSDPILKKSLKFENTAAGNATKQTVVISKETEQGKNEIKNIFDNYPFIPRVETNIVADGSTISIPRSGQFGLRGSIKVVTNGTVEIWSR